MTLPVAIGHRVEQAQQQAGWVLVTAPKVLLVIYGPSGFAS